MAKQSATMKVTELSECHGTEQEVVSSVNIKPSDAQVDREVDGNDRVPLDNSPTRGHTVAVGATGILPQSGEVSQVTLDKVTGNDVAGEGVQTTEHGAVAEVEDRGETSNGDDSVLPAESSNEVLDGSMHEADMLSTDCFDFETEYQSEEQFDSKFVDHIRADDERQNESYETDLKKDLKCEIHHDEGAYTNFKCHGVKVYNVNRKMNELVTQIQVEGFFRNLDAQRSSKLMNLKESQFIIPERIQDLTTFMMGADGDEETTVVTPATDGIPVPFSVYGSQTSVVTSSTSIEGRRGLPGNVVTSVTVYGCPILPRPNLPYLQFTDGIHGNNLPIPDLIGPQRWYPQQVMPPVVPIQQQQQQHQQNNSRFPGSTSTL